MTEVLWPLVFLVLIGVANYRLGQYLNPPFVQKTAELERRIDAQDRAVIEMKSKLNALMVDKGFSK